MAFLACSSASHGAGRSRKTVRGARGRGGQLFIHIAYPAVLSEVPSLWFRETEERSADAPESTASSSSNPSLYTFWCLISMTLSSLCSSNSSLCIARPASKNARGSPSRARAREDARGGRTSPSRNAPRGTRSCGPCPRRRPCERASARTSPSRCLCACGGVSFGRSGGRGGGGRRGGDEPASMTRLPGLMSRYDVMKAMSGRYRIWVRCGRACVLLEGGGRA